MACVQAFGWYPLLIRMENRRWKVEVTTEYPCCTISALQVSDPGAQLVGGDAMAAYSSVCLRSGQSKSFSMYASQIGASVTGGGRVLFQGLENCL